MFVVTIGPLAAAAGRVLRDMLPDDHVHVFEPWSDDLPDAVAALLLPGDVVLLKESRVMALVRLVTAMEKVMA